MNRIALILALALILSYSTLSARERPEGNADRSSAAVDLPSNPFAMPPGLEAETAETAEAEATEVHEADTPALVVVPVPAPSWFDEVGEGRAVVVEDLALVKGRRSYSVERALDDARLQLRQAMTDWLGPEVPASSGWEVPEPVVDSMIVSRHVRPIPTDLAALGLDPDLGAPEELIVAAYQVDFSPSRRAELIELHRRDLGAYRLTVLGGVIGFVLACLAILSIYIRADEATKGYYTTRLRLIAAAGAGAAGLAIYQFLT